MLQQMHWKRKKKDSSFCMEEMLAFMKTSWRDAFAQHTSWSKNRECSISQPVLDLYLLAGLWRLTSRKEAAA